MSILYCDCFSGISGDMFLGALLDAGLPVEVLDRQFQQLNLPEYHGVSARKVRKGALAATLLELDFDPPGHDHEHEHEHGHHHGNRHPADIYALINASGLSERVKQTSIQIFTRLAEAEAKVHGVPVEQVHFHEVGAVDSILDIVGAAIGLEYFDVHEVYASALPIGTGTVNTQHGLLPLPAPATLALIQAAGAPVIPSKATLELVTPTGAAILSTLAAFRLPEMRIQQTGMGAGQRDLEWPNILRVMVGGTLEDSSPHLEIETNIDDMNPQVFGHVMSRLFQAGALDVYFTPIVMKKNRPATRLSVIARQADEDKICQLLLRETSTLGVRVNPIRRHEAQREMRVIDTRYGSVPVKLKILNGEVLQAVPEFDVCARLADEQGISVLEVLREAESKTSILWP